MASRNTLNYGLVAAGLVLSVTVALKLSAAPDVQEAPFYPQAALGGTPAAVTVAPPQASAPPALDVRFTGVVAGPDGVRRALVSVNGAPDALVRVGDTLAGSSKVTGVDNDALTYHHGEREVRTPIQASDKAAQPSTAPATNNQQANAPTPPTAAEPLTGNDDLRQAVAQKMASMKP